MTDRIHVLFAALLAVWLAAGAVDFLCHRVQRIEHSAGLKETGLHGLMLLQGATPVLVGLFLEINAASLSVVLAACVAHEITTWIDLRFASTRRSIPWYEQAVHGVQQAMPWLFLISLGLTAWPTASGGANAWQLQLRLQPMPAGVVGSVLTLSAVVVGLPFLDELRRGLRTRKN